MILFTGDTHGEYDIEKIQRLGKVLKDPEYSKDNYLIVAGDFGCIWNAPNSSKKKINSDDLAFIEDVFKDQPFTTLFIDGNHENHTVLNSLPKRSKWGGQVHHITNYCYHLLRGEVYTLQGYKIFTMGGAMSVDADLRKPGVSWWAEELITQEDYERALVNLAKHDNTVDYVVSHTCPTPIASLIEKELPPFNTFLWGNKKQDISCEFLEKIREAISYREWMFGHFHVDKSITYNNTQFHALYNNIVAAKEEQSCH